MDLWERMLWLAIGCFIGFVLGYIVRSLHDIKEKVEHVEETVLEVDQKNSKWDQNDKGFMRHPLAADIAMILVLGVTIFAAFSTSKVNAELQRTIDCITNHNVSQSGALKSRDGKIKAGTQSEIDLWARYEKLYKTAKKEPKKIPALQEILNKAIIKHKEHLIELQETREEHPYPKPDVLSNCEEGNQ